MPGRNVFFLQQPLLGVFWESVWYCTIPAPCSSLGPRDVSSQFRETFNLPLVHGTFPWLVVSVWYDPVLVQLKHCPAPVRIAGLVFKMALDALRSV